MAPIDLAMIRRRAEHNEGMVSTLEEVSLHQQEIEKIEGLGQICKHLKILYLQNNLVAKLQNLHRLKELEYANFAVNNISKIENLQRCESLVKLDLTVNFITKASLLTVHTLEANYKLDDLYLMGNPCADFGGYRQFVIGTLPQLRKLDGTAVTPSERILAKQELPAITQRLLKELRSEGVDIEEARKVSDARDLAPNEEDIQEILDMPEDKRPWCPATRVAEQRVSVKGRLNGDDDGRVRESPRGDAERGRRKGKRRHFRGAVFFFVFLRLSSLALASLACLLAHTFSLSLSIPRPPAPAPSPRTNQTHQPHFLYSSVVKAALLKVDVHAGI